MAVYRCWSGSGVTQFAQSTAYSVGDRIVPVTTDTGTNYLIARGFVWECTTAGTTAAANPTWPASVTADTTTVTSDGATFTARNPGYSSGTTVNWTFATPLYDYGLRAAKANDDILKIHKTHIESYSTSQTYTIIANVSVLVVDKDASEAVAEMDGTNGYITTSSGSLSQTADANYRKGVFYGLLFRTTTASGGSITLQSTVSVNFTYINCKFRLESTATGSRIQFGDGSNVRINFIKFIGCSFKFGATGQSILSNTNGYCSNFQSCSIDSAGTAPTTLLSSNSARIASMTLDDCDLSFITGTLVPNNGPQVKFTNCKFGIGVTILGAATTNNIDGTCEVWAFNCNSGDAHYSFFHANPLGQTGSVTSIYANDGASYDIAGSKNSWRITTTTHASYWTPYVSPYISKYNETVTSVTPTIEILRDGSSTALTKAEIWPEISYSSDTGSVIQTHADDRQSFASFAAGTTASDVATGVGLSGWTGEGGTAWSGQLTVASFTPQNIGHISARINFAKASSTVYIDPKIRGV